MRIISLASGSRGNAYLVGAGDVWLLIDDGLAWRTFALRCKAAGLDAAALNVVGVLITHEHTDHVGGLAGFLKHYDVPVFANIMTAESVASLTGIADDRFCCFENGQSFAVEHFTVLPFSIPHDTSDPVGYLIATNEGAYFHGTDIGTPTRLIGERLAEADVATLESNHDVTLLRQSNRPPSLIQRIAGPRGHLSNVQSADLVRQFARPRLKRLGLAHLSQDCNVPLVAEETMGATLRAMGRSDVVLKVFSQHEVHEL